MADSFWYVVMVPMVYVSVVWCIAWVIVRIVKVLKRPKVPYTLSIFPVGRGADDPPKSPLAGAFWDAFTMPSVRRYQPRLWVFLIVFHVSLVLLLLARPAVQRALASQAGSTIVSRTSDRTRRLSRYRHGWKSRR